MTTPDQHRVEANRALAEATWLLHRRPPWRASRHALRLDRAGHLIDLARTHMQAARSEPPVCDSVCRAVEEDLRAENARLTANLRTTTAERDQAYEELAHQRDAARHVPLRALRPVTARSDGPTAGDNE